MNFFTSKTILKTDKRWVYVTNQDINICGRLITKDLALCVKNILWNCSGIKNQMGFHKYFGPIVVWSEIGNHLMLAKPWIFIWKQEISIHTYIGMIAMKLEQMKFALDWNGSRQLFLGQAAVTAFASMPDRKSNVH